jgi:hypothetical protein
MAGKYPTKEIADGIKNIMAGKDKLEEQRRRAQQGPSQKKKRPKAGMGNLPGKKKEDSSVTLGKFMKAKVDALNESVAAGGMKRERVTQGSTMRRKEDFIKDVAAGKYKKPNKDAAYYKSIGLTGERGDKAVKDFFKPQKLAKGGRAGFKSGSKGCKLAMKGKGRAYGKNS